MKRLVSIVVTLALMLMMVPAQVFAADRYVQPDSFTVRFWDGNKMIQEDVVNLHDFFGSYYTQINIPRLVLNGEMVVWKADCIDLALYGDEYLSGETLDLDFDWSEKNPVINFKPVVAPESFTVKFEVQGKLIQQFVLDPFDFYQGINIPKVPRVFMDGGMANIWRADCIDLVVKPGDYVSGQTLDLDYLWTETNPTIVFTASVMED